MDRLKTVVRDARDGISNRSTSDTTSTTGPTTAAQPSPASATPHSPTTPTNSRTHPTTSRASLSNPLSRKSKAPAAEPSLASRSYAPTTPASRSTPIPSQAANTTQSPTRPRYEPMESASFLPTISLRRTPVPKDTSRRGEKTTGGPVDPYAGVSTTDYATEEPESTGRWNKIQRGLRQKRSGGRHHAGAGAPNTVPVGYDYDARMVDVLDTIDPEVQTLTSLTNVQNSLFVPNLGKYVNRRPTYSLSDRLREVGQRGQDKLKESVVSPVRENVVSPVKENVVAPVRETVGSQSTERPAPVRRTKTVTSIDSTLSESRYAVLPHDTMLDGWTKDDLSELNDHVRHMLHSRRSKFKRSMKGFGQYVRRPLGFLVTLYATLITLFGLAWVLFLIGWINVGGQQLYIINIIDNVLVALFAIVGDGLAPFRTVDTYRMIYIARYHSMTARIRSERAMPELTDHNDLPTEMAPPPPTRAAKRGFGKFNKWTTKLRIKKRNQEKDIEEPPQEYSVLNAKQHERLLHHQEKFAKSHTFYKPHETDTHFAFPWRLLVAIVVLLDFHSIFQITLGACTWGIYYKVRPPVLTTVILICSITCNATAGLLILIGDKRTRKHDVLERMNRQELTQEAIEKMQKKWEKDGEETIPERS